MAIHSVINLPNEIILKIIFEIYLSKSSIVPFITTCHFLYDHFEFLIYVIKPFKLIQDNSTSKISKHPDSNVIMKRLSKEDNKKILNRISTLDIVSINISKKRQSEAGILDNLLIANMRTSMNFNKLKILNLRINSLTTFCSIIRHLPPNLRVFKNKFDKVSSHDFGKLDIKLFSDNLLIRSLHDFQYFEISFHNAYPVSSTKVHPEFGSYPGHRRIMQTKEYRNLKNLHSIFIKSYQFLHDLTTKTNKMKRLFGNLIHQFLKANNNNLVKLEFLGIDLGLIFNKTNKLLRFPQLRIFSFDNASRSNMNLWIDDLQRVNKGSKYQGKEPLLIMFDKMGEILFYKSFSVVRINEVVSELSLWKLSDDYMSLYAILNIERNIIH